MINSKLSFVNCYYSSYFSALQSYLDTATYHQPHAKDYKLFAIEEGYENNIKFTDLHGDSIYKVKLAYLIHYEFKIFNYRNTTNAEIKNKYNVIYNNGLSKIKNCFILNKSHAFHVKGFNNKYCNVYKINKNNFFEAFEQPNDFTSIGLEILEPNVPYKLEYNKFLVVDDNYELIKVTNTLSAFDTAYYEEE